MPVTAPDATVGSGGPSSGPHTPAIPMYAQLLDAVLADEPDPSVPTRSAGPLAELTRLQHVMEKHARRSDAGWALQAIADQLAYDAALVRLARKRGITTSTAMFDVPERGRAVLVQALADRGVHLPVPVTPTGHHADGGL